MAKRITQNPFRVKASVTETAANTTTIAEVTLPIAPVGNDKVLGLEVMGAVYHPTNDFVDLEDGQTNRTRTQWSKDTGAVFDASLDDNIDMMQKGAESQFTTSGGSCIDLQSEVFHDLTDGDGNGEIIVERSIFFQVQGVGNAGAKGCQSYLLCHLVELDTNEVVLNLVLDD